VRGYADGASQQQFLQAQRRPTRLGGRRSTPMSAPQKKSVRKRRPTLRAALEAAQKAGKAVKSATIKDGEVTLVFGEPTAETNDDWDRKLTELERGKH